MHPPLVVGTDGSADALRAVDWAAEEAALRGCPLRILYASLWADDGSHAGSAAGSRRARGTDAARAVVVAAEERVRRQHPEVDVMAVVRHEDPVYALVDESEQAPMIVVGSRGHGPTGVLLGSVSLTVAARARCPVIVVRHGAPPRGNDQWVVVGLAEPGIATSAAIEFAFTEAALHGYGVEAVHAWMRRHTERATVREGRFEETRLFHDQNAQRWLDDVLAEPTATHPALPVRRVVVEGHARSALLQAGAHAALMVMGARRRRTLGLQLGLVNHAMLHYAPCTIAVVPTEKS